MHQRTKPHAANLLRLLVVVCFTIPAPLVGDITVGGDRPVTVRIPTSYDPDVPMPLLLMLHGFTGTAVGVESQAKFAAVAESRGLLYAHPQGTRDSAGSTFWNATDACCNMTGSTVDDSGYLLSVIEETRAELNVDARQIFLVGWSNGGFMSYRMACEHADSIAAIVSFAGATYIDPEDCAPSEPVHVLQMHGTADNVIRYDGGVFSGLAPHPGALETVAQWARYDGCLLQVDDTAPPVDLYPGLPGEETTRTRYENECEFGGSAELWTIAGGDHTPPFSAFGNTSRFAWYAVDWLLEHPKRPVPVASFEVTPNSGSSPLQVMVDASRSWSPDGTEIVSYEWNFGDGGKASGVTASHTYEDAGRYEVSLTIRTTDGGRVSRSTERVSVFCPNGNIAPWTASDVGTPAMLGGARTLENEDRVDLLVCAGGRDISGRDDEFFFVHQEASGDFAIIANIAELTGGNRSSKAGVMLRASLETDAPFAALILETRTSGFQFRFRYRAETGQSARNSSGETIESAMSWVRVERVGSRFRGSSSIDAKSWTLVSEVEIADLPDTLLAGFAAVGRDGRPDALGYEPLHATVSDLQFGPVQPEQRMLRADTNADSKIDLADAVFTLGWLFLGGDAPACLASADVNGDAAIDVTDPVFLLGYLFLGGPAPAEPFAECGAFALPSDAELGCVESVCP